MRERPKKNAELMPMRYAILLKLLLDKYALSSGETRSITTITQQLFDLYFLGHWKPPPLPAHKKNLNRFYPEFIQWKKMWSSNAVQSRCQWSCGLRRRSVALRLLGCGFESHRGHGCLCVGSVVCCQVEVSATSWSLVQRSPTDCGASLCVI